MSPSSKTILITVDVEDWFQVQNFKKWMPVSSWSSCELRVEKNTHRLLDLLDSIVPQSSARSHELSYSTDVANAISPINPTNSRNPINLTIPTNSPKVTFFVLAWIAERLPHLVREIHSRGHEVASHGYRHSLCKEESAEDMRKDLTDSKKLLEDIIGHRVYGYRAPNFSVNRDILEIVEMCGYLYDSSYNSFSLQARYGQVDLSQNITNGIAAKISDDFYELPISNIRLGNCILPWGGGGYFRLLPFSLFKRGVRSLLKKEKIYLFYMHPWEIDPEQPRVNQASTLYKFRHYVNLDKTYSKLCKLFETFNQCRFTTCHHYLAEITKGVF